jgi:hypothetical protein
MFNVTFFLKLQVLGINVVFVINAETHLLETSWNSYLVARVGSLYVIMYFLNSKLVVFKPIVLHDPAKRNTPELIIKIL